MLMKCLVLDIIKPITTDWKTAGEVLRSVDRETTFAANRAIQVLWAGDEEARKLVKVSNGRIELPKNDKGKLNLPKIGISQTQLYHAIREVVPGTNSPIISAIAKSVWDHYLSKRVSLLSLRESVPSYKTFGIRTSNYTIECRKSVVNGKTVENYIFSIGLLSKSSDSQFKETRISFILGTHWLYGDKKKVLTDLCDFFTQRPVKTPKIISIGFREKNRKWTVSLTYEVKPKSFEKVDNRELEVSVDPDNMCSIKMSCQVSPEVINKSDIYVRRLDTNDLSKTLTSIYKQARHRSKRYKDAIETEGIVGHGRDRAIMHKIPLWRARRNFNLKKNQNLTLNIVRQAIEWKCSSIIWKKPNITVELDKEMKWVFSWPWFEFEQWLKNRCEENGILFTKCNVDGILEELETKLKKKK